MKITLDGQTVEFDEEHYCHAGTLIEMTGVVEARDYDLLLVNGILQYRYDDLVFTKDGDTFVTVLKTGEFCGGYND